MRYFVVVLALLAGVAGAQPIRSPDEQAEAARLRQAAEALERAHDYRGCAASYRDLYRKLPDLAGEEVLYNSMQCARLAGLAGDTLSASDQLITDFPQSGLVAHALMASGAAYADLGQFAPAAERLETFATRYAGEREAGPALFEAAGYRRGLGQLDKVRLDIELYVAAYGAQRPAEAARAMLGLALLERERARKPKDKRDVEATLTEWLKSFASADPGLLAVGHQALGELVWQRACPVKEVSGVCGVLASKPRPQVCGLPAALPLALKPRDPKLVKQAQEHFKIALELGRRLTNEGTDGLRGARAGAQAERLLADSDYEALLANPAPPRVSAKPDPKALNAWLMPLLAKATQTSKRYRVAFEAAGPFAELAAIARYGQIDFALVSQLAAAVAPLARDRKRGAPDMCPPQIDALLAETKDAFRECLRQSIETGTVDDWSRLCERELGRLSPGEGPAHELLPAPRLPLSTQAQPPISRAP